MSLVRELRNIRTGGLRKYFRDLMYIGGSKSGRLVGTDVYGNKYYENLDEIPGRHRWVDYSAHDFNTQQVEPIWHSWLQHIRSDPPNVDPIVAANRQTWETMSKIDFVASYLLRLDAFSRKKIGPVADSATGTRGNFRTYSTVRPKINAWDPKITERR